MMSTVIGGAMLPHAPQFFTMPDTEDKANVEHVRQVAAEIGTRLRALEPDLWIIFSNDHAEQFFHNAAPPFTVHVGGEATGEFAGRKFRWEIPSEIGFELVRALYRQNFDPAFTSTAKIDYAIGIPLTFAIGGILSLGTGLAALVWWLTGRVLRRSMIPSASLRLYDLLVPLFRLERWLPWRVGQSLIAVGEVAT